MAELSSFTSCNLPASEKRSTSSGSSSKATLSSVDDFRMTTPDNTSSPILLQCANTPTIQPVGSKVKPLLTCSTYVLLATETLVLRWFHAPTLKIDVPVAMVEDGSGIGFFAEL